MKENLSPNLESATINLMLFLIVSRSLRLEA
jgi:hypothetical protein